MPNQPNRLVHDVKLKLNYSGSGLPGDHPFTYDFELTPGRPKAHSETSWGSTAASPGDALGQVLDEFWGAFEGEEVQRMELKLTMTVMSKPDTMQFVPQGEQYPREND